MDGKPNLQNRLRRFLFNNRIPRILYLAVLPFLGGACLSRILARFTDNIVVWISFGAAFLLISMDVAKRLQISMEHSLIAVGDTVQCYAFSVDAQQPADQDDAKQAGEKEQGPEGKNLEECVGRISPANIPGIRKSCMLVTDGYGKIRMTTKDLVKKILP